MVEIPRSSFIPKETVSPIPSRARRRRTFHVFGFIGSAMLVVSLIVSAGVFLYHRSVENERTDLEMSLAERNDRLDEEKKQIEEIRIFDRRLKAAQLLFQNHISPSKIFDALERTTMVRIQYMSLSFMHEPGSDAELVLDGGTEEFKTVALQALQFADNSVFQNGNFAEIGTAGTDFNAEGQVTQEKVDAPEVNFTVKTVIPHDSLRYDGKSQNSPANSVVPSQQIQPAASAPATTDSSVTGRSITNQQ